MAEKEKETDPDTPVGGGYDDKNIQKNTADEYARTHDVPWDSSTKDVADKALKEEIKLNPDINKKKPPSGRSR